MMLEPCDIADASGDGVSLGVSQLIEQLRHADTYGSLIRVPEGASNLFREIARRIESGSDSAAGRCGLDWLRSRHVCEVLERRYTTP